MLNSSWPASLVSVGTVLTEEERVPSETCLADETETAIAGLARALLALRPLAEGGLPLRDLRSWPTAAMVAEELGIACGQHGQADGALAGCVDRLLGPALASPALAGPEAPDAARVAAIVRAEAAASFHGLRATPDVVADGARLRSYAAGATEQPAIVLALACGMPAPLCEPWMRSLAHACRVVTWETRGLFGELDDAAFDRLSHGVDAQARDLIAVMDHHGIARAHVMGMCGGAVIAVKAAASHPDRIGSLSLWHGDFSGSPGPTTMHQQNLKALMAMAVTRRVDAAAIWSTLVNSAMSAVPPDLAHLVTYPYVTPELFYRYCVLTLATMTTDVSADLRSLSQPALVVTSADDRTAHPAGSRAAAAALRRAALRVEPHGDHISAFGAGDRLEELLSGFLAATNQLGSRPWPIQ